MKKCDIIIPIYNAYDALKECVESVIKNTDLKENYLLLIDDCSTDKRIWEYINNIKNNNKNFNIFVLKNDENLGFVKTVNKGMKYDNNDVLLLNSDTVVGKDWLDNLKKCAYSDDKIATVTPLSNNATFASIPVAFEKNEIPKDINIDEYNEIIRKCAYCDYPEVPTSHGFCVYIKRKILDLIGYFDEESFERGYGEENEFSFRCVDYGYKHVLCDNVIVYHKESESFSDEKTKVIENHMNILYDKYPKYYDYMFKWGNLLPINYIGKNIYYYREIIKRNNILILIHDWKNMTGGTTLHVIDIVKKLRDKFNFHVLYPTENGFNLKSYFENSESEIYFAMNKRMSDFNKYNNEYRKILENIFDAFKIDLVHIHHIIGHYFDIIDVCELYNVKKIITLHDFYCICPNYNLLYCYDKFCLNIEKPNCLNCLKIQNNINNNIVPEWRRDWHKILKKMDKIIVPSKDTKNKILQIYEDLKIEVIEHGVEIECNYFDVEIKNKFNVAYIGCVLKHKGGQIYKDLISNNKNKKIKFHIFGMDMMEDIKKKNRKYTNHGKYNRDELGTLLAKNNINLICFFQIWPETYSYTLNEAISSGIPVLSFDIGAGAERVKENNLGWIIPEDSSIENIQKTILEISENKIEYEKIKNNIKKYKIKTIEEMNKEYEKIYENSINQNHEINIEKLKFIIKNNKNCEENIYKRKLEEILSSTKWKFINSISFSEKAVKLIRKIIKKN